MGIVSDPGGRGKEFVTTGQEGVSPKLGDFENFIGANRGMHGARPFGLRAGRSRGNVNISWASRVRAEGADLRRL